MRSIYKHACYEKTLALEFFVKEIQKVLLLERHNFTQLIYAPSLKTIAYMLSKRLALPCKPQALAFWLKRKNIQNNCCSICVLSMYPLTEIQRLHLEEVFDNKAMLISLFLLKSQETDRCS